MQDLNFVFKAFNRRIVHSKSVIERADLLRVLVMLGLKLVFKMVVLPLDLGYVMEYFLDHLQIVFELAQLTIKGVKLLVVGIDLAKDVTDFASLLFLLVNNWLDDIVAHFSDSVFEGKPLHSHIFMN